MPAVPPPDAPDRAAPAAVPHPHRPQAGAHPGPVRRLLAQQTLLPAATLVVLLLAWELYGRLGGIDPLFFSYPTRIWQGLLELAAGPLAGDLQTSATELALGLTIALPGIPLGVVVGRTRTLRAALDPLINGLYATPILALTPLLVIWFGIGMASKVAVVALMAFFPLVITAIEGATTVNPDLIRAARSLGASRWRISQDVILPGILPFLVGGLRLAIGRAIMGVVIGEFIAAVDGLGYRIRLAAEAFRTDQYLAGVAILVAVAIVMNAGLKTLEARLATWRS